MYQVGIFFHALDSQTNLLRRKPTWTGCLWEIRQHKHGADGDQDRKRTFDVEEPSPSGTTEHTLHVVKNGGGNECTKGIANDVAAEKDSSTESKFVVFVPFADKKKGPGEEGSLHDT